MNQALTPAEVAALKKEIFSSLHCAMPGVVESFDAATQTASVRPALKHSSATLPVIRDVPVYFPGGAASGITWLIVAGDECLLIFADFDIDHWFENGEAREPISDRMHDLPDAFAFVGFRSRGKALEHFPESPQFFDGTVSAHNHDDRYYTETEADTLLSGKSNTDHKHSAADVTSGSLALVRGGTGQAGTSASATIENVAEAASGCTITTAQFAYWGKLAMVRLVITKKTAVTSGTTTLATIVEGRRPRYYAIAERQWGGGARITPAGEVQINGAITAGESITILSTYVMA